MPIEIKAAVLKDVNQPLSIETMLLDDPRDNEVIIEVKASGVCQSDLHYIDGKAIVPLPSVLGHEAAGVVTAVGSKVTSLKVGDHVVPLFCPECGECDNCRSGKTNVCRRFGEGRAEARLWWNGEPVYRASLGAFASHMLAPEHAVCKIRSDAEFDLAFYCGCGVTTGVGAAMFHAKVEPGSSVIVFGCGGIGLNVLQGARLAGAETIVAVDTNHEREDAARRFGATAFVNPGTLDGTTLIDELKELTGDGADHTFECIGNVNVMRQAFDASNPYWGVVTVVGLAGHGEVLDFNPFGLMFGRRISGCVFGGARGRTDLPKVIDWFVDGKINIADLVTHRLTLDQVNEGFDLMRAGKSIRSVVIL